MSTLALSVDGLIGQWIGTGAVARLQITRTPGGVAGYVGAWMGDDIPRGWRPLTVVTGPLGITLSMDGGRGVVTRTGAAMTGTVTVAGATTPWSATRLRDPLEA